MSENGTQMLTSKQRKAIEALLEGAKVKEAALVAGVATRTIHRWREDEAFALELHQRNTHAIKDAARRLTAHMDDMLDVLLAIAKDEQGMYSESVRVRAALGWIDRQIRMMETTEVLERILRLEQKVGI